MLQILHKGINFNAPLDQTGLTGDANVDAASAYITSLVGGKVATIHTTGLALADFGAGDVFAGFIINDANGYFYENKPALASNLVPLSSGNQVVITDQIDTTLTFAVGDKLYAGSGAKKGLVTNVLPTGATPNTEPIGIAASTASAASPQLTILRA